MIRARGREIGPYRFRWRRPRDRYTSTRATKAITACSAFCLELAQWRRPKQAPKKGRSDCGMEDHDHEEILGMRVQYGCLRGDDHGRGGAGAASLAEPELAFGRCRPAVHRHRL